MDFDEYRKNGKEMVDYIADYLQTIRRRRVFPAVQPGYMCELVPENAPVEGESWPDIFADIERVIMPGMTHWQSPHMHAYFPALTSFPSMMGDMLADAINCIGFTWASAPAATELETLVMDWLAQMLGLPEKFWHFPKGHTALDADGKRVRGQGGGVIQTTSSEATLIALMAGRTEAFRRYRHAYPDADGAEINTRLVGYCSDQAHSSVEKAALMGLVKMRFLRSENDTLSLRGETLLAAIEEDKNAGLIPFYVCATLGTTGACSFDRLDEIGEVCEAYELWLHVDAAYAGTAFICPEFRHHMRGIGMASSFAFNPSKWMMVAFDCTAMWVADAHTLHRTFNVNPLYLKHENSGSAIDYMHWQIGLSKRFRALKLWFVIRSFGVRGLQEHIRKGVKLAQQFEALVAGDPTFELAAKRHLGLVVFRLAGENVLTEKLLKKLNSTGLVHMVPASLQGRYVIRYTVTSQYTELEDILRDWTIIQQVAREVRTSLAYVGVQQQPLVIVPRPLPTVRITSATGGVEPVNNKVRTVNGGTLLGDKRYGTSLLLANSPYSPKFVNGSFAALFDDPEYAADFAKAYGKQLKRIQASSQSGGKSGMTKRRAWALGKQYSLDSRMERIVEFIKPYLPKLLEQSPTEEELLQQSNMTNTEKSTKKSSMRKGRGAPSIITEEFEEENEDEEVDKSSVTSSVACSSSSSSSKASSMMSSVSHATNSTNVSQSVTPCKTRTSAANELSMLPFEQALSANRSRSKSVDIDTLAGVAVEWLQKLGLVHVNAPDVNSSIHNGKSEQKSSAAVGTRKTDGSGSTSTDGILAEEGAEIHQITIKEVSALKPTRDAIVRPGSAQ